MINKNTLFEAMGEIDDEKLMECEELLAIIEGLEEAASEEAASEEAEPAQAPKVPSEAGARSPMNCEKKRVAFPIKRIVRYSSLVAACLVVFVMVKSAGLFSNREQACTGTNEASSATSIAPFEAAEATNDTSWGDFQGDSFGEKIDIAEEAAESVKPYSPSSSAGAAETDATNSSENGISYGVLYDIQCSLNYLGITQLLAGEQKNPGENQMVSPFSAAYALAMTAEGTDGNTKKQIERVMGADTETYASFLAMVGAEAGFVQGKKPVLQSANSIWLNSNMDLELQDNYEAYCNSRYGATVFQGPMDEKQRDEINEWIAQKTDDMIPEGVDEIESDTALLLINALAFQGDWKTPFEAGAVYKDIFTTEDGKKQKVSFMSGMESVYLEDDNYTGFVKPYQDDQFLYVALLPKEGMSVNDLLQYLQTVGVTNIVENGIDCDVQVALPKYESSYACSLKETLQELGMTDAFTEKVADFSNMCQGTDADKLYVGDVKQRTFISVDENGTKAAASTIVEIMKETAILKRFETVVLNRPFVYIIVEAESNIPIFMGTEMDLQDMVEK